MVGTGVVVDEEEIGGVAVTVGGIVVVVVGGVVVSL